MAQHTAYLDPNEPCYVFDGPSTASVSSRPAKRRRVASPSTTKPLNHQLPRLLEGKESVEAASRRFEIYEELWAAQERKLEAVLEEANAATVKGICEYLESDLEDGHTSGQLQAGLITSGLAASSTGSTFPAIKDRIATNKRGLIIKASPALCLNLKTALKSIVSDATQQTTGDDDEEETWRGSQGIRLLDYDLQALEEWVTKKSVEKVIIFFQESEAFDGRVLTELIDVLHSWQDRIRFILLFEIGTSVALFQEKLSRQAARQLRGTLFETRSATEVLDVLFRCATSPDLTNFLWLGPGASRLLLDRQTEHIPSARDFISLLKYMYMMHFFNNPLSLLLSEAERASLSKEHLAAIGSLFSFKSYVSQLLKTGKKQEATKLARDSTNFLKASTALLSKTQATLLALSHALKAIGTIYSFMPSTTNPTWSMLYVRGMSGELAESTTIRELSLSLKKLPSDTMASLLDALSTIPMLDLGDVRAALDSLVAAQNSSRPLRSEHDQQHSTLRTTVVAQKVSLSKHQATLSVQDAKYSELVDRIHDSIRLYLTKNIISPKELPLNEIFVFDSKASCRDALGPFPRKAVERALGSPHDYLDCECCEGEEGLKVSHPATSIVYQLYLESGSMINITDMLAAFRAVIMSEGDEELGESQEQEALALFYRALAELKHLGMIKSSRKKADHVAKLRWRGL